MSFLFSYFYYLEINECSSDPCVNGGICNNRLNKWECICLPGWQGTTCELGKY